MVLKSFETLNADRLELGTVPEASASDIPAARLPDRPDAAFDPAAGEASGQGTILVVDDSPAVCQSLAKLFATTGYAVVAAGNGDEALAQYDPDRIDLVLLDLNMPRRNGWDTFCQITAVNPDQAVILITGEKLNQRELFVGNAAVIMEKPLNVPELLDAVRGILREPGDNRRLRSEIQRRFVRMTRPRAGPFRISPHSCDGLNE